MKPYYRRYRVTEVCTRGILMFPFVSVISFFILEINYVYLTGSDYSEKLDSFGSNEIKNDKNNIDVIKRELSISLKDNLTIPETLVNDFIITGSVVTSPISKNDPIKGAKINNKDASDNSVWHEINIQNNNIATRLNLDQNLPKDEDIHGVEETRINTPGEYGKPVIVDPITLAHRDKILYTKGWKDYSFNEYVSRIISIRRQLSDARDPACLSMNYPENLPDASVVMTFHNEAWSVLLRSVHSILDRSPPHLIKQIILVDDFSTMDHLKSPLEDYMTQFDKVKIVRATKREGLIRARLLGFAEATGAVVIFLDSHIECTVGWLEPLLERIAVSKTIVAAPAIDIINDDTFEHVYQSAKATNIGGFDWSLTFKWQMVGNEERERREYKDHLPIRSPTMAGGLFAISREFFQYLGTYDDGMEFWGGENLELSFRIWMCGGILETIPCSHVGHIFRKKSPYTWEDEQNVVKRNNLRLAEVWLDDFKFYYYQNINYNVVDFGDVSARKAIRQRLNCKSFNWYLTNIYTNVHVPAESLNSGEIRSKVGDMCLDGPFLYNKVDQPLKPVYCHGKEGHQFWLFTRRLEIRHDYGCFDYNGEILQVAGCHGQGGNQKWVYKNNQLFHVPTSLCLELTHGGASLSMNKCTGNNGQIWLWKNEPPSGPVRVWN